MGHREEDFGLNLDGLKAFVDFNMHKAFMEKIIWSIFRGIEYRASQFFYPTMTENCFIKILKFLRFDDKPSRVRTGPNANRFAFIQKVI